mgnify:CR=1 FL=1
MTLFAALHILENGVMKKCKSADQLAQMDALVWSAETMKLVSYNTSALGARTLTRKRIARTPQVLSKGEQQCLKSLKPKCSAGGLRSVE